MGELLKRRPSASLVVAMVALVVALAGGAYAAIQIPKKSVGTKQLKSNIAVARAFAQVNGDGLLVPGAAKLSFNGVSVAHPGGPNSGVYCITGLKFRPRIAVATVMATPTDDDSLVASALGSAKPTCPANTQITVQTRHQSGAARDAGFSIVIF